MDFLNFLIFFVLCQIAAWKSHTETVWGTYLINGSYEHWDESEEGQRSSLDIKTAEKKAATLLMSLWGQTKHLHSTHQSQSDNTITSVALSKGKATPMLFISRAAPRWKHPHLPPDAQLVNISTPQLSASPARPCVSWGGLFKCHNYVLIIYLATALTKGSIHHS